MKGISSITARKLNAGGMLRCRKGPVLERISRGIFPGISACVFIILLIFPGINAPGEILSLEEYESLREEALGRQRRIIWNSDGNDATFGGYSGIRPDPEAEKSIARQMLDVWTVPLAGTHVDSIFYNTARGTFGGFSHYTEVGQIMTGKVYPHYPDEYDYVGPLLEEGTCPLQVHIDFAREQGMEIFMSMRMNDTHDASDPESRFPDIKKENPDYLLGEEGDDPPHGRWSSVDFAHPEVRELAFRYLEEVCRNFDIDGIELDFYRHTTFFRHESWGEPVGQEELDMMTGLIRRIREMTVEVGREQGRPILIAIRVPDCLEYSKAIGLDVETWLSEGLVDIMCVSGEWRMNRWEYSAGLGHRHGVKVYAVLSDTRVGRPYHAGRRSDEAYRGRAMSAWESGVDGIYTFNLFNTRRPIFSEMGEPEVLRGLDRVYYASAKGGVTGFSNPFPYREYINIETLNPALPEIVPAGEWRRLGIVTGGAGEGAEARLGIQANGVLESEELRVRLNGVPLEDARMELSADGSMDKYMYVPEPGEVRRGANVIEVSAAEGSAGLYLEDVFIEIKY